uniref:(California timema) hypothetical protein n=1 Tax=Timema californicum TaxID=61474 RepID=A0A7R9P3S9_TIMCA|nr:unnamed protein product [Timema californicum]
MKVEELQRVHSFPLCALNPPHQLPGSPTHSTYKHIHKHKHSHTGRNHHHDGSCRSDLIGLFTLVPPGMKGGGICIQLRLFGIVPQMACRSLHANIFKEQRSVYNSGYLTLSRKWPVGVFMLTFSRNKQYSDTVDNDSDFVNESDSDITSETMIICQILGIQLFITCLTVMRMIWMMKTTERLGEATDGRVQMTFDPEVGNMPPIPIILKGLRSDGEFHRAGRRLVAGLRLAEKPLGVKAYSNAVGRNAELAFQIEDKHTIWAAKQSGIPSMTEILDLFLGYVNICNQDASIKVLYYMRVENTRVLPVDVLVTKIRVYLWASPNYGKEGGGGGLKPPVGPLLITMMGEIELYSKRMLSCVKGHVKNFKDLAVFRLHMSN